MKQFFCLLNLALITLLLPGAAPAQTLNDEARKHFEQGIRAKSKDRALEEFKRAIDIDSNYVEAHREFQNVSLNNGKAIRDAIIQEYRRQAAASPHSAVFHYLLGRLLETEEAEKEFLQAVQLDPKFFWAHFGLSSYYHNRRDREKADLEQREAVELLPESVYAHTALANLLSEHQKDQEAVEVLEKAQFLAANKPEILADIARQSRELAGKNTTKLIVVLSYLVATLISSAFAFWSIKGAIVEKVLTRLDWIGVVMILYICLWFCVLFIAGARGNNVITGFGDPGIPEFIVLLCIAFWPTVAYHTVFLEKSATAKLHSSYKIMVAYYYLSGIAVAGMYSYAIYVVAAIHGGSPDRLINLGSTAFLVNFVLYGILSVFMTVKGNKVRQGVLEDPEVKAARRWEFVLLVLFLFIFLPLCMGSLFHVGEPLRYLSFASTLLPLPFLIVSFYYEARYAFMDVFIKRSTVGIVIILTTIAYYLMVVEKFADKGIWKSMRLAELMILLPLVLAVPFLASLIQRLVDRYVFKRKLGPSEALSGFSRAIRLIESEERLFNVAASYIGEVFAARNVRIGSFRSEVEIAYRGAQPIPQFTEQMRSRKGAVLVDQMLASDPWKLFLAAQGMQVATFLRTKGEVGAYVALGRRQRREPYLSEDIELLNSLTDQLEFALETIRLEQKRREQESKEQELKILASKAELRALRAQINPHFLFNALNTIASLIKRNPPKAEETVEMLAEVFRHALAKSGTEFIPVAEEIEFINAYLEIEKARFGDKLQVETRIDEEAAGVKIPTMVLQPLVENALKHGISPKVEGGRILISARCENGSLKLEVADDGVGFDGASARRLYKDGVGVKNVRDRLRAIYGNEDCMQIHSVLNQGTRIHITIPVQ